jgi:hypothetical protein
MPSDAIGSLLIPIPSSLSMIFSGGTAVTGLAGMARLAMEAICFGNRAGVAHDEADESGGWLEPRCNIWAGR